MGVEGLGLGKLTWDVESLAVAIHEAARRAGIQGPCGDYGDGPDPTFSMCWAEAEVAHRDRMRVVAASLIERG